MFRKIRSAARTVRPRPGGMRGQSRIRLRNHVRWRLAYWRVAISACDTCGGQTISPRRCRPVPRAPMARAEGGRVPAGQGGAHLVQRAASSITSKRRSIASASQSRRRCSTRRAASCASGSSGGGVSACQSARPRPVARSTSHARWTRAGLRSVDAGAACGRRARPKHRGQPPGRRSIASASARISGGGRRDLGQPAVSAVKIEPGAPRRRSALRRSAAAPRPRAASGRRNRLRRGRHGHRGACGAAASSSADGRAVSTRQQEQTCSASALTMTPPCARGNGQRQRRFARGRRPGDQHRPVRVGIRAASGQFRPRLRGRGALR